MSPYLPFTPSYKIHSYRLLTHGVRFHQENPKREVEDNSSRGKKGDEMIEAAGIQNQEQRQPGSAPELAQAGHCVSSQQPHTELDSDVSDDTDQELDIEDDEDFTLNPQF